MMTAPRLDDRGEQAYVGIRALVMMHELGTMIPQLLGETFAWLEKQGLPPAGAPFIRYYVIDMAGQFDIELGVPAARAGAIDGPVQAGVLPAGRYASLVYTGIANGMTANAALLDWIAAEGHVVDGRDGENGETFGARLESFLTDPAIEPDQAKWETEFAIRLADHQSGGQ